MLRVVIQHLLLFVLPTVLYGAYVVWARRRALIAGQPAPSLLEGPWFWLIVSGGILVLISLASFAIFGGYGPEAVYEPATLRDGEIVPGRLSD